MLIVAICNFSEHSILVKLIGWAKERLALTERLFTLPESDLTRAWLGAGYENAQSGWGDVLMKESMGLGNSLMNEYDRFKRSPKFHIWKNSNNLEESFIFEL